MPASLKMPTAFAIIVLLTGPANAAPEDNLAKTQTPDGASLHRILSDWQRQSAARTSLDVRFVREDRDSRWGDNTNHSGRVVFLPNNLALVEVRNHARTGQPAETVRFVWTTDEFHQIRVEQKMHLIMPIAEKDRGRLPAVLALPFFWHLNIERLKSRYRVELLKEQAETWLLRITPLTDVGRQSFATAFLYLDRSTYLPRRYLLIDPSSKSTHDFRVTDVRSADLAPDLQAIPDDRGWKVVRLELDQIGGRLYSLFKPDLLP